MDYPCPLVAIRFTSMMRRASILSVQGYGFHNWLFGQTIQCCKAYGRRAIDGRDAPGKMIRLCSATPVIIDADIINHGDSSTVVPYQWQYSLDGINFFNLSTHIAIHGGLHGMSNY
ncbi:MAG: hypothetical protein R2825_28475 [Saprospiraceae bacterium]